MKRVAFLSLLGGTVVIAASAIWRLYSVSNAAQSVRISEPLPEGRTTVEISPRSTSGSITDRTEAPPLESRRPRESVQRTEGSNANATPGANVAKPLEAMPTTPQELSSFLAGRKLAYGSDVFYAAVERVYADELRNAAWASRIESVILGLRLPIRGGCRASLCVYRLTEEARTWNGNWRTTLKEASRKLAFGEQDSKVEIEMVWSGENAGAMYILDREPPADYVEPLLQMLPMQGE